MKIVVIANQKGGSGKSTSTVHLAVAAEQAGDGPVVIADSDPQGSTVDWFNQRKKAGIETPRYAQLALSGLPEYLRALTSPTPAASIPASPCNPATSPCCASSAALPTRTSSSFATA
jgi:cellulose biosynthesis protein BcsQ